MQQELQRSSPYVFIDQGKTQIVMRDNVQGYQQGLNADMVWFDQVTKYPCMQLASSHVTGRGTRAGLYCRPAADLSLYGKIMS
ncbi:hypothetical protein G9H46_26185, partial [Escherichia coli]|nr:hypothetical protein [Escherichia coli]